MVDRNMLIAVAISVVVFMGFIFMTNMTGHAVTGSVVSDGPSVENEYFNVNGEIVNESKDLNETNKSEVDYDKG